MREAPGAACGEPCPVRPPPQRRPPARTRTRPGQRTLRPPRSSARRAPPLQGAGGRGSAGVLDLAHRQCQDHQQQPVDRQEDRGPHPRGAGPHQAGPCRHENRQHHAHEPHHGHADEEVDEREEPVESEGRPQDEDQWREPQDPGPHEPGHEPLQDGCRAGTAPRRTARPPGSHRGGRGAGHETGPAQAGGMTPPACSNADPSVTGGLVTAQRAAALLRGDQPRRSPVQCGASPEPGRPVVIVSRPSTGSG